MFGKAKLINIIKLDPKEQKKASSKKIISK